MNKSTARAVTPSPEIQASLHEDGLVLLDTKRGLVYTSNRTGAQIWRGITERQPLSAIVASMSRQYGVSQTVVEEHADAFVADLNRRGIVIAA